MQLVTCHSQATNHFLHSYPVPAPLNLVTLPFDMLVGHCIHSCKSKERPRGKLHEMSTAKVVQYKRSKSKAHKSLSAYEETNPHADAAGCLSERMRMSLGMRRRPPSQRLCTALEAEGIEGSE